MIGRAMRRRAEREEGIALISTMLVVMIVVAFTIVAMSLALHSLNTTSVDRKRTQAVGAAEAGIDVTLQNMVGTNLPCSAANALGTGPTQSSYSVTVAYYDSTGAALTCTAGSGPSGTPASALLTSTGTTNANNYGDRLMHAFVKLSPITAGGFDKAIFANSFLTFNNNTTIQGTGGNNADLYTNSTYTCTNNQMIYGNVYTQGDISGSNTCSAAGDWWAKGKVSASGNGSIGGNVYAAGDTSGSPGTVSMGNTTVAGNAIAKGTISPTPCGPGKKIAGTCSAHGTPGDPPFEAFPVLDWNATPWTGAGYTVVDDRGNCNKLYTDLGSMAASTTPTVFLADCQVNWGKQNTWTFNTNVAVWSSAGMDTSNAVTIQSASATTHNFYMIVPHDAYGTSTPITCGSFPDGAGNIAFKNQTTIGSASRPLDNFIYTPCGVSFTNNQTNVGQIYGGGTVVVTNNFSMTFVPVPVPGGALSGGGGTTGYSVALEYKREG